MFSKPLIICVAAFDLMLWSLSNIPEGTMKYVFTFLTLIAIVIQCVVAVIKREQCTNRKRW